MSRQLRDIVPHYVHAPGGDSNRRSKSLILSGWPLRYVDLAEFVTFGNCYQCMDLDDAQQAWDFTARRSEFGRQNTPKTAPHMPLARVAYDA